MLDNRRQHLLRITAASLAGGRLVAQASEPAPALKPAVIPAGSDRLRKTHNVGVSSTTYKVLTAETAGAMFVLEQANAKKGGPSKHLHVSQDELFYVMQGEYVVEIGLERFHLRAGDCVLGPRQVPHAWAFVGESTGRLLLTYSPAGKMEEFFNNRERLGIPKGSYASEKDAATMRTYGMELVGPPIALA